MATGAGFAGRSRRASPRRRRRSFRSPEGKYRLEGLWPYAITASGDLYVPQLDPMTVAVRGALHKDHLQMDELDARRIRRQGVTWPARRAGAPQESWSLAGSVKGINPGSLRPGLQRLARLQHEGERRAFRRRRHARFRVQRSLRKAARQHRHRQRAHRARRARTGPSTSCASAPATRAWPSTANSAHRARSISISASTPTTSRCWPKARAASCTPAAASAAPRTRRSSSSRRAAAESSTARSERRQTRRQHRRRLAWPAHFARRHRHLAA